MATHNFNKQIVVNHNLVLLDSHYNNANVDLNKYDNLFQMGKLNDAFILVLKFEFKFIFENILNTVSKIINILFIIYLQKV